MKTSVGDFLKPAGVNRVRGYRDERKAQFVLRVGLDETSYRIPDSW